jgi:hypothetical protein
MTRLVQIQNGSQRRIALVEEPRLRLLAPSFGSVYALAQAALAGGKSLTTLVGQHTTNELLDYDVIYAGQSPWLLLSPVDHPADAAHCLISGTGLTHLGSAKSRDSMHGKTDAELTDSMRIFRWGLERGRPAPGEIGVAPEWFHKGNGTMLRAPGEPLDVPPYAEDGGEEGEIVGVYLVGPDGMPHRLGMTIGNEFSDHVFERKNYLNLAGSKSRTCSVGPELVVDPAFGSVPGKVTVTRAGAVLWAKDIATGETEMCHSLANIEHHHFKFEVNRRPGDVHVHFYGACALSYGDGVRLADGDMMEIAFTGFGRALRNPLRVLPGPDRLVTVQPLG